MTSVWNFYTFSASPYAEKHRLSQAPHDLSRPCDCTAPPPQSGPMCPRRKNRYRRQNRLAEGVEWCFPGDAVLDPRDGGGSPGREDFSIYLEAFGSRDIFFVPCLGFPFVWKALLLRGCNINLPRDSLSLLWVRGRALNSAGPGQWFESRLLNLLSFSFRP